MKPRTTKSKRASNRGIYLCLGLLVGLSALSGGVAAAVTVLLLPSLLMGCLDREPGLPTMRAMALFGLAPSLDLLGRLWSSGADVYSGLAMVTDPVIVGKSWAAQGGAWLLAETLPTLLVLRSESRMRDELAALAAARRDLEEEWANS